MRRRRTKYTWFPNIGFQGSDEFEDLNGFPFTLSCPAAAGGGDIQLFDLIPDFVKSEPSTTAETLNEFIGNEYLLKRIVGKLFAACVESVPTGPVNIIFGAGFFVARADEAAPQLPIGGSGATNALLNYGPLNNQNIREPWIWRRVWKLQNPGFPVPIGILGTVNGQSVADGPHIDAKSARRVRQDERLFLAVSVFNVDDVGSALPIAITGYVDYRVLGALRKAKSRSAF